MARTKEPSYAELVYGVLKSAEQPLAVQEILARVDVRRKVDTRDPERTVRNALAQSYQLLSLGDGRYGYLPHLMRGVLVRVPLLQEEPADHPLAYSDEAYHALFPGLHEIHKRRDTRAARVRLPNGEELTLTREYSREIGSMGSPMPDALRRYLAQNRATEGDALLIRVVDAEERRYETWFEPRHTRDEAAVARRNAELADATYAILRQHDPIRLVSELALALLARGAFLADVAPDPLEPLLQADPRFVAAGSNLWVASERVTPEMEERIRRFRSLVGAEFPGLLPGEEDEAGAADVPSLQNVRRTMERAWTDLAAVLSEHEFQSEEEENAFLAGIQNLRDLPRRASRTALATAQDLIYDAWEVPTSRARVRMAKKALAISPDCADAYVILAEETAHVPKEAAELYAKGVAAGERALGEEAFDRNVGAFWGILETRPYMRARLGLAFSLWEMGRQEEATVHAWQMLRLNPNDNQGVRYVLMNWLLEMDDDAQMGKLLRVYPNDIGADWLYGRALHAFRVHGDTKRSRRLRAEAENWNPHVPDYILGRKRLPRRLPDTIGMGDESEAISCAAEQMPVWYKTPGAVAWLEHRGE